MMSEIYVLKKKKKGKKGNETILNNFLPSIIQFYEKWIEFKFYSTGLK